MHNKRLVYVLLAAGAMVLAAMAIALAALMPKTDPDTPLPPPGAAIHDGARLASPVDVVRAYVDAWNDKSLASMEALMVESAAGNQAIEYDVQCVDHVELLSCEEIAFDARRVEAASLSELYESAHAGALVETSYIIYYNDKGVEIYQTDSMEREKFLFWLIQEGASSEWLIAMQGE